MKTTESVVKIRAPAGKVWLALTMPDLVKQWQYGSDLLTTWEPGTPITFRNEWNGQVFEQKGTVLEFAPESHLKYSLFFPRPDVQDIPENHFFMTYEPTDTDGITSVLFRQEDPRPSPPDASSGGDEGPNVLAALKELVELKMPCGRQSDVHLRRHCSASPLAPCSGTLARTRLGMTSLK